MDFARVRHPNLRQIGYTAAEIRTCGKCLNPGRQGRNYFSRNALGMPGQISGDRGISRQLIAITKRCGASGEGRGKCILSVMRGAAPMR